MHDDNRDLGATILANAVHNRDVGEFVVADSLLIFDQLLPVVRLMAAAVAGRQ